MQSHHKFIRKQLGSGWYNCYQVKAGWLPADTDAPFNGWTRQKWARSATMVGDNKKDCEIIYFILRLIRLALNYV